MLKQIEAVIFDMDGTLIDSMWLWKAIDIDYLKKHGHDLPDDLQKSIEGMSFTETAVYFKDRFHLKDDVETIKEEWNLMAGDYYKDKVTLKDHAGLLLDCLKSRGIKTGIGTSNSSQMVQVILDKFSLGNHIDTFSTSCEVAAGKPNPDVFLSVAKKLGVAPENCLVFEDVPMGIMAAKNAGMKCCAVYDASSMHMDEEKKALADYYIHSYEEVLALCGA